jgi:hypothetical protein
MEHNFSSVTDYIASCPQINELTITMSKVMRLELTPENNRFKKYDSVADRLRIFSQLAYKPMKYASEIHKKILPYGYVLDMDLSLDRVKVFVNYVWSVTVAFRGTYTKTLGSIKDNLCSDIAIAFGLESSNKRFHDSNKLFHIVKDKYPGYKIDVTGHSLGGQIAKYVTDRNLDVVDTNYIFSRGSGVFEPFRPKSDKTVDVSNWNDPISLGARLQGGNQLIETSKKDALFAHNIGALCQSRGRCKNLTWLDLLFPLIHHV